MGNTGFNMGRTNGHETLFYIEPRHSLLCCQRDPVMSSLFGEHEQMQQQRRTYALTPVVGQYRHAPDFAAVQQTGGANDVIFLIHSNGKDGIVILGVPFQFGIDALFFNKDFMADMLDAGLLLGVAAGVDGVVHADENLSQNRTAYLEYSFVNSTANPI